VFSFKEEFDGNGGPDKEFNTSYATKKEVLQRLAS